MGPWQTCVIMTVLAWAQGAGALEYLGSARSFTDDPLRDHHDRWRTFSDQGGFLFSSADSDLALDMVELRFGAEAISPWNLRNPDPDLGPFASLRRAELRESFDLSGNEMAAGLGLSHVGSQIGTQAYTEISLELAAPVLTGPGLVARPYPQTRSGIEDLITFGADIILGDAGVGSMRMRDQVTGPSLPRPHRGDTGGVASYGVDVTHGVPTDLLPDVRSDRTRAEARRWPTRLGVLWRAEPFQILYGATWLSEDSTTQPESQIVGALHLNFEF